MIVMAVCEQHIFEVGVVLYVHPDLKVEITRVYDGFEAGCLVSYQICVLPV